jgi:hypothetical protein
VMAAAFDVTYHGEAHHPAWAPFPDDPTIPNYQSPSEETYAAYRWHLTTLQTPEQALAECQIRAHEKSYGVPGVANSRLSPLTIWRYCMASQHHNNLTRSPREWCGVTRIRYTDWTVF